MKKNFPGHGELDQAGLEALSITDLVKLYNEANPSNPVKLFMKKPVAVERVWASYPEPTPPEPPPEAEAPGAETASADPQPDTATNQNEDDMAKKNGAKKTKKAAGPKTPRKGTYDPESKIHLLVKDNPKREGSDSYKRYAKYKNGMKVKDALEAGVKSADLAWDSAHGYIKID